MRACGVDLDRIAEAHERFKTLPARAYLEVHIEQGPVLESLGRPTGVVVGTFGVERHRLTFRGQAAHAGSTPIAMRRDAFLAAAQFALEARTIALRYSRPGANVVCTCGVVEVEPGIVTVVPGVCRIALDQRALDSGVLAAMLAEARSAAQHAAEAYGVSVEWSELLKIDPRPFDPHLIAMAEEAVREVAGDAPLLPSGPLHDATEMARWIPTVMLFASSRKGLSHCREEDTPLQDLDVTIRAALRLVDKIVGWLAAS
ncbi:MAG: M20/M25/M40 family metallo-hydrolase, partial [Anaerolineae bacterium]|nr:M20/M25/M40 family metallo-hydrolase [Anaerolineae bacterium]